MIYGDIQTIGRWEVTDQVGARELISARDLQAEAAYCLDHEGGMVSASLRENRVVYLRASAPNAQCVEVVFFPAACRAGIAEGAGAAWTDADSADDALRWYFEKDGEGVK